MVATPNLPGRLGNPDLTLGTDPRADARIVAVLAAMGLDAHPKPLPVEHDSPMEAIHEVLTAPEVYQATINDINSFANSL